MFGLEGSGFIVALGVTLLVSGAIVYYCNSRIAALEKALVQQNQVLSDFIVNMRASLENQAPMQQMPTVARNDHASDTAIEAAKAYYSDTVPENKIEVSEDNESEEDSDDEDDLESGSELDSEEEEDSDMPDLVEDSDDEDEDAQPIVLGDKSEVASLEIEEVEVGSSETHEDEVENQPRVIELTDGSFDLSVEPVADVQQIIKLGDVDSLEELEKATTGSLSDGSSLSSHDDEDDASTVLSAKLAVTDLKKIKVTQLKEMAVSAGKTPAEAKKMKKAQLVEFLEAKRAELQ